jgi:hypothetical protein
MRSVLLLVTAIAWGQIEQPRIGVFQDRAGAIRPLLGIAGAFVSGEPIAEGVRSLDVFHDRIFLKLTRSLKILDAHGWVITAIETPEGKALFSRTMMWFAETRSLFLFEDGELKPIPFDEEVVALGDGFLIARRGATLWKMRPNGELIESLDHDGAVLVLEDGSLLWAADVPVEGALELRRLGPGWVYIRTADRQYAVRLSSRRTYSLPESPP